MIRTLEALAEYIGADAPMECVLSRRLYKSTDCGAWLKVIDDDPDVNVSAGVMIGSIVEGVDQCTQTYTLTFPFKAKRLDEVIRLVEEEAQEIWDATHGCENCGMGDAVNPDCRFCSGNGVAI